MFLLIRSLQKLLLGCTACDQSVPEEHVAKRQGKGTRPPIFWKVARSVMCVWFLLCMKLILPCKLLNKMFAAILITYLKCFWTELMQWHLCRPWDRVCCSSTAADGPWMHSWALAAGGECGAWTGEVVPSLLWYSAAKQVWQVELVCRHKCCWAVNPVTGILTSEELQN